MKRGSSLGFNMIGLVIITAGILIAAQIHGDAWLSVKLPITMYVSVTDPNGHILNEGKFILEAVDYRYPNTPNGGGGIKVGDLWVTWKFEGDFVNYMEFVEVLDK